MVVGTRDQERRENRNRPRVGRHRAEGDDRTFAHAFATLGELAYTGARVSASAVDLRSGEAIVSIDDRVALPIAGVGKLLLLIELSARMSAAGGAGFGILDKTPADAIGASGIWQRLQVPVLPVSDLALLTATVSDNLATNVLLRHVGLESVRARAESLGLRTTAMLDVVRSLRGPDDAPQLSVGSTAELCALLAALARGEVVDTVTSQRVLGWLSNNADLSMVASAFGLDPLSHRSEDHQIRVINLTGADAGVRAETGLLRGPRAVVAYAVTVTFADTGLPDRLRVLDSLKAFGQDLLEYVH